jgi:O-glycosyl hydrolase
MARLIFVSALIFVIASSCYSQNVTIDGAKTYQTIHGLGVNANPQSWNVNPEAVRKVLDELIDSVGCTTFRLMFDDCDWEKVNDNDDPDTYNWNYYDSVYSAPRFTGIWDMIRYLNSKGITDITLSPDGAGPSWMGGTTLTMGKEMEYAEMMSSMIFYAKKRLSPAITFNLLSPINESTCGGGEGVVTTKEQFGRLYSAIATHFINDNIPDISIIGPDDCQGWEGNFQAMLKDSITMSKVKQFGQHDYGNSIKKAQDLVTGIKNSSYPDRQAVMTEVNAVCKNCDGGVYNKDYGFLEYAGPAYQFILQDLNVGIEGIQVWEAYDSRYHHPNRTLTWSMWGIFAVNDTNQLDVYSKRTHYYVLKQLYNFVKPGFKRIDMKTNLQDMITSAFYDKASGKIVITGINNSSKAQTVNCKSVNLPKVSSFSYYYSDATHNFVKGSDVKITGQTFFKSIPPHSVFTFVSQ